MKSLIIAEKPSVAADIARALGKFTKKGDAFENEEYVISSALGHLVELVMPEDIDEKKYRFWRLETLPIIPEEFRLKPIERTKERFDFLRKLLARKDVGDVINACDAGREGELIFNYIYQLAGSKKPVKRLWMSSMTPTGIREAFRNLRESTEMKPLADAARCRSESDWLIGINGTRAITKRMFGSRAGRVATVGRVQTPTLAIVLEREREIRNFKPRTYWRITGNFKISKGSYEGVFHRADFKRSEDDQDRADRIWDRAMAEAVMRLAQPGAQAEVTEEKKSTSQSAPRLYDLTTLQREANNRFSFSARRTLQLAQALYEKHKMITYPRTDSRALPEDYGTTCREVLGNLGGDLAQHAHTVLENGWVQPNKRIFNNAQVSDHFAIIPTAESAKNLGPEEQKIFDMISRRFVAVFFPAAQFDVTTRWSRIGEFSFKTEGKVLTNAGWLAVYGKEASETGGTLPPLDTADGSPAQAALTKADMAEEMTKPPPRYTEATLLSAMEGAGKLVDEEELAEAMKEKGLGTPATRAQTIEHLINEKYMDREHRELIPTAKAESLIEFLSAVSAEALTSPALTGNWEYKLRKIEEGTFSRDQFMSEIVDLTKGIVDRTKGFTERDEDARPTSWTNPADSKPMLETLRSYKSQDGNLVVYKVIGNRRLEEAEVRQLVEKRQIGPLDNFRSKSGKPFSAILRLNDENKVEFVFENRGANGEGEGVDFSQLTPIGKCPRTGGEIFETPGSYVVRVVEDGKDRIAFRVSRKILGREIPPEQVFKLLETGKTDLLDKFWSKRTNKPFSAFLVVKPDGKTGFEFAPRAPKAKKNGTRDEAPPSPAAEPAPAESKK